MRDIVPLGESGYLDFVMLEPDRLFQMCSLELDVVETKRFLDVWMGDDIDCSNCTFQTSERAIADHAHTTTGRKYRIACQREVAPVCV